MPFLKGISSKIVSKTCFFLLKITIFSSKNSFFITKLRFLHDRKISDPTSQNTPKFRENPEQFKGLAQVQAFLELSEPVTSESQVYKYRGTDPIMVMQVLDAVVPGSAKDFIKNEFLNKLGINNYKWRNALSGLPIGDSGVSITSRDMLKLGALLINKGQWNGEQLLSADYLAKATSAITRPTEDWQPETFFYGYLWYQTDIIL